MNKEFLSILERSKEIHIKKNQDYTSGTNVDENFERVAEIVSWFNNPIDKSFAGFIAVKLARLSSLLNKSSSKPNFESVDDTFVDLVTYAGLWGGNAARRLNDGPKWDENTCDLSNLKSDIVSLFDKSTDINIRPITNYKIREQGSDFITPINKKINEITSIMARDLNDDECRELLSLARILKSRHKITY